MADAQPSLIFKDAVLRKGKRSFDESLLAGQIIGLAGLDGHGQEAFLEAAAGLVPLASGAIELEASGQAKPIRGYHAAARLGVAYLPRERRTAGIFPNLSVLDNFAIASLSRDAKGGLLSLAARKRRFETFRDRLAVVVGDADASISRLSGGNQQKVLLARLLARDPVALLLNDPTRGVDVATRRILYRIFRDLSAAGMVVVVLSTEIEELTELCDRVLVFREHELVARLGPQQIASAPIIAAMFGEAAPA
jgi:ribose transport system ATP-binding protein